MTTNTPSKLEKILKEGHLAVTSECGPPRGSNPEHIIQKGELIKDHVDAINQNGLRVSGASGDRVVTDIAAHSSAGDIGTCDLVIIATKADGVEGAARSADTLCKADTLILTI